MLRLILGITILLLFSGVAKPAPKPTVYGAGWWDGLCFASCKQDGNDVLGGKWNVKRKSCVCDYVKDPRDSVFAFKLPEERRPMNIPDDPNAPTEEPEMRMATPVPTWMQLLKQ